jgi:hypothetical protein
VETAVMNQYNFEMIFSYRDSSVSRLPIICCCGYSFSISAKDKEF